MAKPGAASATSLAAKAAMETRISSAAAALAVAAPSLAKTMGKTYETWVMFELAVRLSTYFKVVARNSAGKSTTTFRVRGGPGHIPAGSRAPADLPCYFELPSKDPWRAVELHNSLEHVGVSEQTHELDISLIFNHEASLIRSDAGGRIEGAVCWVRS